MRLTLKKQSEYGMFCPGWQKWHGMLCPGWQKWHGMLCPGWQKQRGMFCPGWQIFVGCFVQGVKKWHGMFCPGMFCPAPVHFHWLVSTSETNTFVMEANLMMSPEHTAHRGRALTNCWFAVLNSHFWCWDSYFLKEAIFFCMLGLPLFGKECPGTPALKIIVRALRGQSDLGSIPVHTVCNKIKKLPK